MNVNKQNLFSKDQTAQKMHWLVESFYTDLNSIFVPYQGKDIPLSKLPIETFFNICKDIKYKIDEKPIELLMRPYYAIEARKKGLDCKKKAVLMASFAKANNIPYRFIASSIKKNKRKHHVFTQLQINGEWINFDCTYDSYYIGQEKEVTSYEVI